MVSKERLELSRPFGHYPLKVRRLPFRHLDVVDRTRVELVPLVFQTNAHTGYAICPYLVPKAGLEPARSCDRQILSLLCLPFHHLGIWRRVRDSNPKGFYTQRFSRPPDYQLSQLSILAGVKGVEPLNFCFRGRGLYHLSTLQYWLGQLDSNQRMRHSKCRALPAWLYPNNLIVYFYIRGFDDFCTAF